MDTPLAEPGDSSGGDRSRRYLPELALALITVAAVVSMVGASMLLGRPATTMALATERQKPNIIFVLTDDLSLNLMRFMPNTRNLIGGQGAEFSNYFDNISLCCPARTSIMRGQYAHNTGVEDNAGPNGGFGAFYTFGLEHSTVGTWLQHAGYTTTLMGKYLNNYPRNEHTSKPFLPGVSYKYIPPGWNNWFVPTKGDPYTEFNYTMNDNGRLVSYGHAPQDYMVDVESRHADQLIRQYKESAKPYFMYIATYAPHSPYRPAPRYVDTVHAPYPKTPAYDEADVHDKPSWMANLPPLTPRAQQVIQNIYDKRAEAVKAVDDLVRNLYTTLKATGELNNTYVVFTSDNGYHMGEHRLGIGKNTPYETDTHLPLYVRGPGIPAGSHPSALVGNIDLAPTFAQIAGAQIPAFVDGISFLPEALDEATQRCRQYYLFERDPSTFMGVPGNFEEPPDHPVPGRTNEPPPPFQGVRSKNGYVYIVYADDEREYYNLNSDPYELRNLLGPGMAASMTAGDRSELAKLEIALSRLRTCAGAAQCTIRQPVP